ncbi:MAG: LPD28 domain-containing protein [Tumebacillaceae bacterium]
MMKKMKFKGQKVEITTDRIPEEDRNPDLYYYEFKHDEEKSYLPYMIESEVNDDFWGTMISEEPFEFNNGDFHSLTEDLGQKLAKAFNLI